FDFTSRNTPVQIIERHAICLGELLGTESVLAYATDMTSLPFVFHDRKGITCSRDIGKAKHFNRSRRPCKRDFMAAIIKHRPHATIMHPGYIRLTYVEGSLLDQDRRYGPPCFIELGFDHSSLCQLMGIRLQFEDFSLEQNHFEQIFQA